jgi:hypothetical protein
MEVGTRRSKANLNYVWLSVHGENSTIRDGSQRDQFLKGDDRLGKRVIITENKAEKRQSQRRKCFLGIRHVDFEVCVILAEQTSTLGERP